jgi:microcystin-dependent protein
MADPFIGEIRAWGINYLTPGWLPCDGRQLTPFQYQALYAVIGAMYGGDGRTYFNLPNLQGYAPIGVGAPNAQWQATGPIASIALGSTMGAPTATLSYNTMPRHNHQAVAGIVGDTTLMTGTPTATTYLSRAVQPATTNAVTFSSFSNSLTSNSQMAYSAIQPAGGNAEHENRQPFLVLNFYIAYEGIYPLSN